MEVSNRVEPVADSEHAVERRYGTDCRERVTVKSELERQAAMKALESLMMAVRGRASSWRHAHT